MLMLLPPVFESLPSSFVKHNTYWEYPTTPINGAKKKTHDQETSTSSIASCVWNKFKSLAKRSLIVAIQALF